MSISVDRFRSDILRNRNNIAILERWDSLGLKDGWLVAGCLFQTVWNVHSGFPPESRIKDYDFFYFDHCDLSEEAERETQCHVEDVLKDLGITVEVVNQARVHLWYEGHFGKPYPSLRNAKEGIDRFLIPGTCLGINPREVYAPNGFDLVYGGVLGMNPLTPHKTLFEKKAASYQERWPWLTICE